jgi:aerobic-type carbon monoxide dehydrogenase small subunit (CoxS/CutS family)
MLVIAAFRHKDHVSDDELIEILSSNLCRCTGYENIIGAVKQWLIDEGKYHV